MLDNILTNYHYENSGVLTNLRRILQHGVLGNSGKLLILPVDQGMEHGPDRSFGVSLYNNGLNGSGGDSAYDPDYHMSLAVQSGVSAYAAPLGMLLASSHRYAGLVPTILKLNSNNSLVPSSVPYDQAITGSVRDALQLGCVGVGLTIYPGSAKSHDMLEEAREMIAEARSCGLVCVVWSYPRGEDLSKDDETALDVCAYAAHMAAMIGAHIIKVKLPTSHITSLEVKKLFDSSKLSYDEVSTLRGRVRHVVRSCFNGKRLVVFSGGAIKDEQSIYDDVEAIVHGGGTGSIIGRNVFQRNRMEAIDFLSKIQSIMLK